MKKFVSLVASLVLVFSGVSVQAGTSGSAISTITGLKVQVFKSGIWKDATGSFNLNPGPTSVTNPASDFKVSSAATTATNNASLGAFFDSQSATLTAASKNSSPFFTVTGDPDAPAAVAGPGGVADPYIQSDTTFGGSPLSIVNAGFPVPIGAFTTATSDFIVSTPGLSGNADGTVKNDSSIRFVASSDLQARLVFSGRLQLGLNYTGTPVGVTSVAGGSYTVQLSQVGGGLGTTLNFDRDNGLSEINNTITLGPGAGAASYDSGVVNYVLSLNTLLAGKSYAITLQQNAGTSLLSPAVVPEPTSLAVFGLLSLGTVAFVRRRK